MASDSREGNRETTKTANGWRSSASVRGMLVHLAANWAPGSGSQNGGGMKEMENGKWGNMKRIR